MVFNNSIDAKQQGTQYLSTAGVWTGLDASTAGFVLTSNGTGVAPSFQIAGGGGGITTINGDTGSITGASVTIKTGNSTQVCGATVLFTNSGTVSTLSVTDVVSNTIVGKSAGNATYTGINNTSLGENTYLGLTSGSSNACLGSNALVALTTGSMNCCFGEESGRNLTTGQQNTFMGWGNGSVSGVNYTLADSSNICLNNIGVNGESNAIRIGTPGSGAGEQNACFIAGIHGTTVTGAAVLISTSGQLGDISSSREFKENIQTISSNENILNLRPVSFNYKTEEPKTVHFGFIAEEVEECFPDLVIYNEEKKPYSLKYHEMPALLLAEIQNLRKEIADLKEIVNTLSK